MVIVQIPNYLDSLHVNGGSMRLFFAILFSLFSMAYAGTTGKIAGAVSDAESGEPMPGINIYLQGTTQGAATDIEGIYVINNISPGSYTVIAEAVGYARQEVKNVQVNADFTTKLNFKLTPEVMEGETVVVEAEREMIRKDLTSSQTSISSDEIEALPVEDVQQILTLQAGITEGAGGELHIRGGRSTEVTYNVNGISVSNPFDNSRSVQVATNAISELSVVSGTFNAEYGNALSGIVNMVTKEGGKEFKGSVSAYSGDYLSSRDDIFLNIGDVAPLANNVLETTFSGPIPGLEDQLTFFASARFENKDGYLYGIRQHLPSDEITKDPNDPQNFIIEASGDNKKVPMNASYEHSITGKLTFKPLDALKLNYDVIWSNSSWKSYSHSLKYNPEANYNRREWGIVNTLELKHVLSPKTFYTLRGSWSLNDFNRFLYPLLDGSGNTADFFPGEDFSSLRPDPRYRPEQAINVTAANYTFNNGGTLNDHFYQRSNTYGGKIDLISQVTNSHEIKMGVEGKMHTIDYQFFTVKRESMEDDPFIPSLASPEHERYSKKPVEFSAYAQDKMEFESLVLNVGLRFDYMDAKSQYSTDLFNPTPFDPDLPGSVNPDELLDEADPKYQLSPRLGVSFPISSTAVIHFSYGHFFQLPPFRFLYSNSEFAFTPGIPTYGNADLKPEKNVSYEIGLQQQLTDNTAFTVTGYYKDVRDLLALQRIRVSTSKVYDKYVNKDYANIKGIVLSFIKQRDRDDMVRASLDYTFQVAEGNDTDANAFFSDLSSGTQSEKIPVLLSWDQTHTINGTFSLVKSDWNSIFTVIGRYGNGLPYTPVLFDRQIFLRQNSERKPMQLNVDLMAEKTFAFNAVDVTLFMKVFNLFDRLNERFVYNDTGTAGYSLEQSLNPAKSTDKLAEEYEELNTVEEFFNNPSFYLPPREVRVGITVGF